MMEKDCKCGGGEGFYNFYILYCNITVSGRAGGHHHAVTASPPPPPSLQTKPNQAAPTELWRGGVSWAPAVQ